jgi:FG-GAP-like repeat
MRTRLLLSICLFAAAAVAAYVAPAPMFVAAQGSPIAVAPGPNNVAIADVTNDSKPDLIVTSSASRLVTVLVGRGDGQFTATPESPFSVPESPNEVAVGDVDGDSRIDLTLASHDTYNVVLLLGDGRGGFRPAPGQPIRMKDGRQPHTHGLVLADLTRDKHPDLATVNSNDDDDVSVAIGNGRGQFVPAGASPFDVGRSPYPMAHGDIDNDSNIDLVVTSTGIGAKEANAASPSRGLTALLGDGRGGFQRRDIPLRTSRTWFVAVGDLNGDRLPDLAATHTENEILTVLLGTGRGAFAEVKGSPFRIGGAAWQISIADFNRDGSSDIIAAANTNVRVLTGDGRGGFRVDPALVFPTGKGSWRLAVADLNGDGNLDVVTSNLESNDVSVLLGR